MKPLSRLNRIVAWIAITAFSSNSVLAAPIDLATSPLVTGLGKVISPNIFFILDDSLSMTSEYMPDAVNDDNDDDPDDTGDYDQGVPCTRNFGYNTIYYNPSTTYTKPVQADGTDLAYTPTISSARSNGFGTGTGVDLTSTTTTYTYGSNTSLTANPTFIPFAVGSRVVRILRTGHGLNSGDVIRITGTPTFGTLRGISWANITWASTTAPTQPLNFVVTKVNNNEFTINVAASPNGANSTSGVSGATGYNFSKLTGTSTAGNYYYYRHNTSPTSPPSTCGAAGDYTKVEIRNEDADQQQNFANWYSFYRTRLLMMKTASGRAFVNVTDKYRVGYTTISEKGTGSSKFLDVKKFDTAHKSDWFTKLYGASGASFTPLRGALSKAGRYYAGKLDSGDGSHDPIQYSCQKNYTILTTDGFWNSNNESPTSDGTTPGAATTNYGPFQIDNVTRVGDQDGASAGAVAPFKDALNKANTLADVAYYYYNTDLRPTTGNGGLTDEGTRIDVSANNVPTSNTDPASHQHMTTFTLSLGLDGTLANPGAYASILDESTDWPDPIGGSGATQEAKRIDDLWHAAVNGRGTNADGGNLSAKSPGAVVSELTKALSSITAKTGSSSAAATSNLQPVSGDNTAFIAQYKTVEWTGDLIARTINVTTGVIESVKWNAQALLDAQAARNIYTFSSAASNRLRAFTSGNLATEIGLNYFKSDSTNPGGALPQYTTLAATAKLAPATGFLSADATSDAMIDYIRGVRTRENTADWTAPTNVFREREHVLGDIVSAAPVFVRKPPFAYTDPGYVTFLANQASRAATVYVGANDGMLHAFDATTDQTGSGSERWAYIPTAVVPNLYKLASSEYSLNHRFYVDGPITVGDAYDSATSSWSTILVGGLGGGGKAFYALDVTDPASPKALWEFGTVADYTGDTSYDADLGYSYGNPVITKRASDGKWVVIFASGYNNTSGDKKGRLYVIDAFTGAKLSEIITSTAADENLSGIARVSNFVTNGLKDNSTQFVYAGDLSGALWRFDINAGTVQKLGSTSATAGNQPITIQPELALIKVGATAHTVVLFGTGRYLGPNDLTGPSATVGQAIYAVKDTGADLGVLTTPDAGLVSQTLNTGVTPRTTTNNAVDWTSNNGWYVTVPVGERFNVDPTLQLGVLSIAANKPNTDYCQSTGSSILYQLNYKSGFLLKSREYQSQVVGNTVLLLGGSGSGAGTVYGGTTANVSVLADGSTQTESGGGGSGGGTAVRVSWREIE